MRRLRRRSILRRRPASSRGRQRLVALRRGVETDAPALGSNRLRQAGGGVVVSGFAEPLIEVGDPFALDDAETTVVTNLHGPIRLIAALPPHQRARTASTKVNLSSGLAFVPIVAIPAYSATNAAPHSYTLSLREQFKGASIEVIEIHRPMFLCSDVSARRTSGERPKRPTAGGLSVGNPWPVATGADSSRNPRRAGEAA